jgi:hypothetical protein
MACINVLFSKLPPSGAAGEDLPQGTAAAPVLQFDDIQVHVVLLDPQLPGKKAKNFLGEFFLCLEVGGTVKPEFHIGPLNQGPRPVESVVPGKIDEESPFGLGGDDADKSADFSLQDLLFGRRELFRGIDGDVRRSGPPSFV